MLGAEECRVMNGSRLLVLLNVVHYINCDVTRMMGAIGMEIGFTPMVSDLSSCVNVLERARHYKRTRHQSQ